jgi:DNA-binding transcriptional LysR family regulator
LNFGTCGTSWQSPTGAASRTSRSEARLTLNQRIWRLEEIVGTSLLQRRREGLQLTAAGSVLLDASLNVLSLVPSSIAR